MNFSEKIELTRKNLDKVSSTFCLAKWLQLSLHLESGQGHSCHHPTPEFIPEELVSQDPLVLHNSPDKIIQRKDMLKGGRPAECSYCWKQESIGPEVISDRLLKSGQWLSLDATEVSKTPVDLILPRYVEVSFSNKCNLKCSYCSSLYSSAWAAEDREFGSVMPHITDYRRVTYSEESNPYIEAFWKLWPKVAGQLQILRITGGEPLLSTSLWQILERMQNSKLPQAAFVLNSNLMVSPSTIDKLAEQLNKLVLTKSVKSVKIVTSLESDGEAAEYSRFGLKTEKFWKNVDSLLLQVPELSISITNTMQILSVTTYVDFLDKVLARRHPSARPRLLTDPSLLKKPPFLALEYLPSSIKERFAAQLSQYMENTKSHWSVYEFSKINNLIVALRNQILQESALEMQMQAKKYFKEYDLRRQVSFAKTFPELRDYYGD